MDEKLKAIQEIVGCGDELVAEIREIIMTVDAPLVVQTICKRVGAGDSMEAQIAAVFSSSPAAAPVPVIEPEPTPESE